MAEIAPTWIFLTADNVTVLPAVLAAMPKALIGELDRLIEPVEPAAFKLSDPAAPVGDVVFMTPVFAVMMPELVPTVVLIVNEFPFVSTPLPDPSTPVVMLILPVPPVVEIVVLAVTLRVLELPLATRMISPLLALRAVPAKLKLILPPAALVCNEIAPAVTGCTTVMSPELFIVRLKLPPTDDAVVG